MEIESITHKGLKKFFEKGQTKGLVGDVNRLRLMLVALDAAVSMKSLRMSPPNFGLHPLEGDRKGYWSMTVTKNWRLTFFVSPDEKIYKLDLEDYHGS